ncbi:MAG: radical SAM protein [Pseudomonadota bacterium]|nr:radical SAM protein [Pseudomonadota bacterium]
MSVETVTLGCRLNFAESETMRRIAPPGEDWMIVNSCAVTAEAVRQTRQAIRRAHRKRPDARILVTGCAAELDRTSFEAMPEVARVVGNAEKLQAFDPDRHPGLEPGPAFPSGAKRRRIPGQARDDEKPDAMAPSPVPAGFQGHVRSFVAVQTGCDHRCTFCTIWQARGPSRSYPFEAVRDAVGRELDRGAAEIVLTGVDITDYQGGLGTRASACSRPSRGCSGCGCRRSTASRSTAPCSS